MDELNVFRRPVKILLHAIAACNSSPATFTCLSQVSLDVGTSLLLASLSARALHAAVAVEMGLSRAGGKTLCLPTPGRSTRGP